MANIKKALKTLLVSRGLSSVGVNDIAEAVIRLSEDEATKQALEKIVANIADEYDPVNGTYPVDDYVFNDDILYKCTTAVTTPEPFDSTKWTHTTIESVLAEAAGGGTEFFEVKATTNIFGNIEADKTWSEISATTKPILLSYNSTYYIPIRDTSMFGGGSLYVIHSAGALGALMVDTFSVKSFTWQSTGYSVTVESKTTNVSNITQSIAPSYLDIMTYNVGDLVIYDNYLYQCTTAVSAPESFDSSKWNPTTIAAEIASLRGN